MKKIENIMKNSNEEKKSTTSQEALVWLNQMKRQIVSRYGNASKFALAFNPSVQMQCALNIERSLIGSAPTINQLLHTYQLPEIQVWMMAQTNDLNDYAGVKNKMSVDQMKELAKVLIVKCKYLKASEILLFFHMLKSGDFGSFYGTVDPQKVGEYMNEFLKWRRIELDKIHYKQTQLEMEQKREMWKKNAISREEYLRRRNGLDNEVCEVV